MDTLDIEAVSWIIARTQEIQNELKPTMRLSQAVSISIEALMGCYRLPGLTPVEWKRLSDLMDPGVCGTEWFHTIQHYLEDIPYGNGDYHQVSDDLELLRKAFGKPSFTSIVRPFEFIAVIRTLCRLTHEQQRSLQ